MKFEYRLANFADIDELVRLRTLMQFEGSEAETKVPEQFTEKVKSYFLKGLSTNYYCSTVAVFEKRIVANAGVVFYEKPPILYGGSGLAGYVTNVYTEKEFRRLGIGTQLLRELNSLALERGADKLHLGATAEGLSVYKAVGYTDPSYINLEIRAPFGN